MFKDNIVYIFTKVKHLFYGERLRRSENEPINSPFDTTMNTLIMIYLAL